MEVTTPWQPLGVLFVGTTLLCCHVLQRVTLGAACCNMLQRVAACCSVLQRVAACCSVLQYLPAHLLVAPWEGVFIIPSLFLSYSWQDLVRGRCSFDARRQILFVGALSLEGVLMISSLFLCVPMIRSRPSRDFCWYCKESMWISCILHCSALQHVAAHLLATFWELWKSVCIYVHTTSNICVYTPIIFSNRADYSRSLFPISLCTRNSLPAPLRLLLTLSDEYMYICIYNI